MNNIIRHALKGMVSWEVSKRGKVLRKSRKYSNLILNQGLDYIATNTFADCFLYCAVGDSNQAPDVLDLGLINELDRTGDYGVTEGSNGATLENNVFTIFRTFVFDAHVAPASYKEVGFSPSPSAGNNLFSRALLKDSEGVAQTVNVGIGETLTVRYELSIEIYDAVKRVRNAISGQPGNLRIQKVGLKGVNASGATEDYDDAEACNEPSVASNIFLSNEGSDPEPFGSCLDRSPIVSKLGSLSNYVTSSYERSKGALFKPSERSSSWRSVGVGSADAHGAILVFDSPQSPDSNKAYLVTFNYYWIFRSSSNFSHWLDGEDYLYLNKRVTKANTYAYFAL